MGNLMKLFLDDERNPPDDSWIVVRDARTAIHLLRHNRFQELSLDHDLGTYQTGYDVCLFLEERAWIGQHIPPILRCHSQNPVGRNRILRAIGQIAKIKEATHVRSCGCDSGSAH